MSITKDHRKGDEMDVTEELCRLLDEQGLEWREHEAPAAECIAFFDGNGWHDCWESVGGEVNVTFSMTPEQAIAATLGRGECRYEWSLADNGWADHTCSACGYVENTDIHVGLGWNYCPNCGRRIVDPTTNDVDAEVADG